MNPAAELYLLLAVGRVESALLADQDDSPRRRDVQHALRLIEDKDDGKATPRKPKKGHLRFITGGSERQTEKGKPCQQ